MCWCNISDVEWNKKALAITKEVFGDRLKLAKAGFVIKQMIKQSDNEMLKSNESNFAQKAKMLPVTFVIKARKR